MDRLQRRKKSANKKTLFKNWNYDSESIEILTDEDNQKVVFLL